MTTLAKQFCGQKYEYTDMRTTITLTDTSKVPSEQSHRKVSAKT